MSNDPSEAYKIAKEKRAKRLSDAAATEELVKEYPALVDHKLHEIDVILKANVPDGLALETKYSTRDLSKDHGVKSLFLFLREEGKVVAQGCLTCTANETIVLHGFPTDESDAPTLTFAETSFADYAPASAVGFLARLIETYIV